MLNPAGYSRKFMMAVNKKMLLAIFKAEHIAAGTVAQAYLDHTFPLGFHGYWHPQP